MPRQQWRQFYSFRRRPQGGSGSKEGSADAAIPPLRKGAPGRRGKQRGDPAKLLSEEGRPEHLKSFDREVLAESTRVTIDSQLRTLRRFLRIWKLDIMPLTAEKVRIIGAALKHGRYKAAKQYLSAARTYAARQGQWVDGPTAQAIQDLSLIHISEPTRPY